MILTIKGLPPEITVEGTLRVRDGAIIGTYTGTELISRPGVYEFNIGTPTVGDYEFDTIEPLGFWVVRIINNTVTVSDDWLIVDHITPVIILPEIILSTSIIGRLANSIFKFYNNEEKNFVVMLSDLVGVATFEGLEMEFLVEDSEGTDVMTVTNLQSNTNALLITTTPTNMVDEDYCPLTWSLRVISTGFVLGSGLAIQMYAATVD